MRSVIVGRRGAAVALAVGGLLTLAACGSGGSGGGSYGGAATTPPAATQGSAASGNAGGYTAPGAAAGGASAAAPASGAVLSTASSKLGTIVVDSHGMTVYEFGKDTMGATTSACTGACATLWPEVHAGTGTPQVSGVTGTVGTITGVDGQKQLTLNGWPLYTFTHDKAPGDTTGQNFMNLWWALTPSGEHAAG